MLGLVQRCACRFVSYHSKPLSTQLNKMKVNLLPALEDNYMYLLVDEKTNEAAIVDPVEPDKVLKAVEKEGVKLTTILTTHHHWDHAGGNKELISKVGASNLKVYGGDDRIDGITTKAVEGLEFNVGSLEIRCLFTPCHTTGHICYFVKNPNTPAVFTGDTLFVSGCGRFFEGTAEQMYSSLVKKLSILPPATQVYCGHEYTVSSLKFAQFVQPNNQHVLEKLNWSIKQRENNQPTIPSTIAEEMLYNPFMRVENEELQKRCKTSTPVETMKFLRNEKDHFKANV
uniref:hydroxyacylglutathione hydrolase, mitochondrial-like n=1 Tax=Ciona intestinalis TaxID=7719 RepID=UPI000180D3D8|nr:hydroxyacylglutathione hydrolase, mitochondrial-like [Ciona intestinalis]|eukprot:XP_002130731.1 hydroxyacylglutathione hydrolase, mitochondrial-like [Ciona intestinalis]